MTANADALAARLSDAMARHDLACDLVAALIARGPEHPMCPACSAEADEPCSPGARTRTTYSPRAVHSRRMLRFEDELRSLRYRRLEAREVLAAFLAESVAR